MASRTLETRFERLAVQDENDHGEGTTKLYSKSKVSTSKTTTGSLEQEMVNCR